MPGKKGMGSCLFGCGRGVDSIEHYAHCAILRAARETNVTINTIPCGIDGFLMLHCRMEEHVVIEHARYIYAFYMCHCILRHTSRIDLDVSKLIQTMLARTGKSDTGRSRRF